jgi:hypothetical protein
VQKHFPQFQKYANKCLTEGLKTAQDSFTKEGELVHGDGCAGMEALSLVSARCKMFSHC